jgi:hypothetical protein
LRACTRYAIFQLDANNQLPRMAGTGSTACSGESMSMAERTVAVYEADIMLRSSPKRG